MSFTKVFPVLPFLIPTTYIPTLGKFKLTRVEYKTRKHKTTKHKTRRQKNKRRTARRAMRGG